MKFESPPNEGTTVRKQDTPEEIAQKKIRRQGAAVAAVGLLALSDVQAMEVPEAPLSEPTAVIQYEPSPPSANVRVPVDKNGRASLPAKSFQNPEEVLVTSDDVIGSVPSAEEKPGRTVLFSDYQTRKVPSANPEVVNEQYHTRIDQLKKVTPPDFRTAGEQEIDASMMRIDRAFRIPESISWTHEQVSGLLARVAEVTGADPTGRIQQAADILLSGAAELADSVLSGKLNRDHAPGLGRGALPRAGAPHDLRRRVGVVPHVRGRFPRRPRGLPRARRSSRARGGRQHAGSDCNQWH